MIILNLTKRLVLLTFVFFLLQTSMLAQKEFSFHGKVLYNNRPMSYVDVMVYENNQLVNHSETNKYGSFTIELNTQKEYLLEFKGNKYPIQKVYILTYTKKKKQKVDASQVVINLPFSNKVQLDGDAPESYITSFSLSENGIFKEDVVITKSKEELAEENKNLNKEIIKKEDEIKNTDNVVAVKKEEVEEIKDSLSGEDLQKLNKKLDIAYAKIDSMLAMAEKKANLIVQAAELKSKEIISKSYLDAPRIEPKTTITEIKEPTKGDLKKIGVDEKEFYSREDIKKYQKTISDLKKSNISSKKDSIKYLDNVVKVNEELLKAAKLKLEIDKLNARTYEDSLKLKMKEEEIAKFENEIKVAEKEIELQKMEIENKNLMLTLTIAGLLFFVILSLVVYQNYRLKNRINERLEQQNREIALKNKKIIDSITYAKTIQQAILPIKSTLDKYFNTFIIFQPKDIVSGDFYWFTHFKEINTSVFAVVDCTGHGVPGAFMSMIGNRLLVEVINEKKTTNPKDILDMLDAGLRQALMQDETLNNDGMDMCVCTIKDEGNGNYDIGFAGAKRPLFYAHQNKIHFIKGTVRGIGGRARLRRKGVKPFVNHQLNLKKGDILYMTTDGFLDLQSPERKKFGRKNFIELLENVKEKEMTTQAKEIANALDIHKGNEQQIDDITILGIKL